MGLDSEFNRQGNWLFRWRSYLPLAFLPLLIVAVINMHWPFGSLLVHEYLEFFCLGISLLGLLIRVHAVGHAPSGTSGRNTHAQVADSLNTTGFYSVVRHPLYLGNYLIGLGAFLVPATWWLPVIFSLSFWLYYERIMFAEEAFLREKFGESYSAWARVTPAFIPNFKSWQKPKLPFSLAHICKREYTALGLIVLLHGGIEATEHLVIEHHIPVEPIWVTIICIGLGSYLVFRALKKHTDFLNVAGR
jgi:protein-S-isoprenylcysteine O-methyltransferase Ste14